MYMCKERLKPFKHSIELEPIISNYKKISVDYDVDMSKLKFILFYSLHAQTLSFYFKPIKIQFIFIKNLLYIYIIVYNI